MMLSSGSTTVQEATLELMWGPSCKNPPTYFGIYRSDPSLSHVAPEMQFSYFRTGRLLTNYKLDDVYLSNEWSNKYSTNTDGAAQCLIYTATYMRPGSEFLSINCLKIRPNWMSEMTNIADIPLSQLFIPGSHASGCYLTKNGSQTASMNNLLATQNFDVWTQLLFGVRYLDFTVIYSTDSLALEDKDGFMISNDGTVFTSLAAVLKDVQAFVNRSNDVIIIEFSVYGPGKVISIHNIRPDYPLFSFR